MQAPEPFLRPNQLRDFVLDHIHNANTRQHLWAKVQPIIETNANVRVGEQEVQGDTWKVSQVAKAARKFRVTDLLVLSRSGNGSA